MMLYDVTMTAAPARFWVSTPSMTQPVPCRPVDTASIRTVALTTGSNTASWSCARSAGVPTARVAAAARAAHPFPAKLSSPFCPFPYAQVVVFDCAQRCCVCRFEPCEAMIDLQRVDA